MAKGGEMKDDIKLTREEWRVVEEQCKDCQFWGYSQGCMLPEAIDPEPALSCDAFVEKDTTK